MSLRYDAAFYVQVLDKYVATGECAEADNEPLYAFRHERSDDKDTSPE